MTTNTDLKPRVFGYVVDRYVREKEVDFDRLTTDKPEEFVLQYIEEKIYIEGHVFGDKFKIVDRQDVFELDGEKWEVASTTLSWSYNSTHIGITGIKIVGKSHD